MKFFDLYYFSISFAIGVFFVYCLGPERKEIVVYPSEDTLKKIQYEDDAGQCFGFDIEKTTCPINPDNIQEIPIQAYGM